jgi:hypothetical protein
VLLCQHALALALHAQVRRARVSMHLRQQTVWACSRSGALTLSLREALLREHAAVSVVSDWPSARECECVFVCVFVLVCECLCVCVCVHMCVRFACDYECTCVCPCVLLCACVCVSVRLFVVVFSVSQNRTRAQFALSIIINPSPGHLRQSFG